MPSRMRLIAEAFGIDQNPFVKGQSWRKLLGQHLQMSVFLSDYKVSAGAEVDDLVAMIETWNPSDDWTFFIEEGSDSIFKIPEGTRELRLAETPTESVHWVRIRFDMPAPLPTLTEVYTWVVEYRIKVT